MQNLQSYRRVWGQEKATLEADGRYPFLNQQGLCDIYEWIFLNAMSEVCRVYPRRITQYYDLVMRTLSMSCPEVARMISFQLIWVEAGIVQEHIEKQELAAIITEERLKPEETWQYIETALQAGEIKTTGTDIDRLMPPVSRFGGGNRAAKKQGIIDKLKAFFDKFFGIA